MKIFTEVSLHKHSFVLFTVYILFYSRILKKKKKKVPRRSCDPRDLNFL